MFVCVAPLFARVCVSCVRARAHQASSSDMQRLHDAFSVLMTSLRFGSAAYLAGDTDRAKRVFTEAASLFARLGYGFLGFFGFLLGGVAQRAEAII